MTHRRTAEPRTEDARRLDEKGMAVLVRCETGVSLHALPREGIVDVGRGETALLCINDASVSRRHALLHVEIDRVLVEDLGSHNGTSVGEQRLLPNTPTEAPVGALIQIGDALLSIQPGAASSGARLPPKDAPSAPSADGAVLVDGAMQKLARLVDTVATTDISVLLLGETGAGKEVWAERVHARSRRASGPLVRINCAALPESLLESELFGYERGAFTGATQSKAGLVETAHGGTLFLDEIGEISATTQAKLLRVLESGEVLRVGGLRSKVIDVRFVSATNRDLRSRVRDGGFRSDLYFRLNGMTFLLPPLRERPGEILPLARHFIDRFCARMSRPSPELTGDAEAALLVWTWPGNVRELRACAERLVVLAGEDRIDGDVVQAALGPVDVPTAPPAPVAPAPDVAKAPTQRVVGGSLRDEVEAIERERIRETLASCGGNQARACELLGLSRRMLLYKMDQYGIPRPRKTK